jgi:hypothetical protein
MRIRNPVFLEYQALLTVRIYEHPVKSYPRLQGTAIPTADMAATAVPPAGAQAADSAAGPAAKCAADPPGADPGVGGAAEAGLTKHTSPKTLPSSQSPTSYFPLFCCVHYYCPGHCTFTV